MSKRAAQLKHRRNPLPWDQEFDSRFYPGVEVVRRRRSNVEIAKAIRSPVSSTRIAYLRIMQVQVRGGRPAIYFEYARKLLSDRNNTCRWQAAILLGLFIPYRAEELWDIIVEFEKSRSDDMRACIACVLLEHFLPTHATYRSQAQALAVKSRKFERMLSMCAPCEEFADLLPKKA